MEKKKNKVQQQFIQQIRDVLPGNISLVDELAELLNVSNDSAYRRIRCETSLSLDEATLMCQHYKIPLDAMSESANSVTFNYTPLGSSEFSFQNYLNGILADLKKMASFENKQIIFAAEDIPIFHHFTFNELTAFKLFYWNKSILNVPSYEGKKFSPSSVSPEIIETAKEIQNYYALVPSIEIWTEDTINSTLKQVEFYWEAGLFENVLDASLICEQFLAMLEKIQKQAELSRKYAREDRKSENENNFVLYNSEVMIGNNCILRTMGNSRASYLSHHTFNSMITSNASFCDETEEWLKNLIKKSTLISGVSEKQRHQFFKKMAGRIEELKLKFK
jgi:hypothetical protein